MQNNIDMAEDDDLLAFDDDQSETDTSGTAPPWRILIVDDDPICLEEYAELL